MSERPPSLIVKNSSIHGCGCYAGEFIPAGTFLLEYTGELIPAEEAYRREEDPDRSGVYTFWMGNDWAIDGYAEGNTARYINHSCTPNCEYRVSNRRVLIYSERDIHPGEELTIDYSYAAEGERIPCCCGSSRCRGCINAIDEE
jgi:SET domain-containing protein